MKKLTMMARCAVACAAVSALNVASGAKISMVNEPMLVNATNATMEAAKAYTDSKEFTRVEKTKYHAYYVTTNTTITVGDQTIPPMLDDAFQGMAFDLYNTNSVYFIDDVVPTLKFFAPYRRQAYWPNQITAVEIGDPTQVFRTYFAQVDGNLAVNSPTNIRFMSTLDRNAPFDQGRSMSLQDYLDAFNPMFASEMLRLYQTNRADYSIGNMTVHDTLDVRNRNNELVYHVTQTNANFYDSFVVKPQAENPHWEQCVDGQGITNYYLYAKTNSNVDVYGNIHVSDSMAVSKNFAVWGKLQISAWENVIARIRGMTKNEYGKIVTLPGNEAMVNPYGGKPVTMEEYMEYLNEGIIAATNEYRVGDVVLDTSRLSSNSQDRVTIWRRSNTWRATCFARNKRQYLYDATKMTYKYRNTATPLPIVEIVFTNPNGNLIFGAEPYKRQQLDCKYVFDLSGSSSTLTVDVGTWNFVGMGESVGAAGEWETIYSSQEPNTTTQTIVHTETYTYYDWIWDDDVGDWVEDREHPYTESYEWTEDYTVDMNWVLQPYKCYEFTFKQCGDKAMKVDMHEIYKTNPYRN